VSSDAIIEANGITNPDHIREGDVLKIPVKE
jgi:nucleoid-associated protein YgaU